MNRIIIDSSTSKRQTQSDREDFVKELEDSNQKKVLKEKRNASKVTYFIILSIGQTKLLQLLNLRSDMRASLSRL